MGVHVHVDVAVNDHVNDHVNVKVKVKVKVNGGGRRRPQPGHLLPCRRDGGKFAGLSES